MKVFRRSSKEEAPREDRRKDKAERARRQHEIEEERRRRLQPLRRDIGPISL
jgi:hypothetical protein